MIETAFLMETLPQVRLQEVVRDEQVGPAVCQRLAEEHLLTDVHEELVKAEVRK